MMVLGCATVALGLIWALVRDREPSFQGQRLSYWLLILSGNKQAQVPEDYERAVPAIRSIGPDAIPYLLKWAGYEPPQWQRKLNTILPMKLKFDEKAVTNSTNETAQLAGAALIGFTILESNAVPAIPQLETMMNARSRNLSAARAIEILADMGMPAFPALTNAVAVPNHTWRGLITAKLGGMAATASPADRTNLFLPVLRPLIGHSDFLLSYAASNAVSKIEADLRSESSAQ